jgi:hypothetical protein
MLLNDDYDNYSQEDEEIIQLWKFNTLKIIFIKGIVSDKNYFYIFVANRTQQE